MLNNNIIKNAMILNKKNINEFYLFYFLLFIENFVYKNFFLIVIYKNINNIKN